MPADKNFTFICGADDFLVGRLGQARFTALAAETADEFSREVLSGFAGNVAEVESALNRFRESVQTVSMFGGKRVLWLKDVNFLADTVTGRSESVALALEALCEILKNPLPDGVTFLMSAPEPDKRRSAYKQLTKLCKTSLHDKPVLGFGTGEEEVVSWTAGKARDRGLKISHPAVEALAARVGLDSIESRFGGGAEF